jgi:aryl-alcohol dehydrogenase-like predicted oxidoreductase
MRKDSLIIAQTLKRHAEKKGMSAAQFALNWVLNNALVTSVLAGPRTFEQWREYIAALGHGFGADDEALVDQLVARGHCSTPGYTDPKYPVTGRVPLR